MIKKYLLLATATVLLAASCKKDPKPDPVKTEREISISVENFAGTKVVKLDAEVFQNEAGEDFTVSIYKYYLSNFKLYDKGTNAVYIEPNSYHLIDAGDLNTLNFTLPNVPQANYDSISFLIGVDQFANTSGAQSGDLSPTKGMFWSWTTGYIMAKMEGESPSSGAIGGSLSLHIGGFNGQYDAVKEVGMALPEIMGNTGNSQSILLRSDLLEWFKSPTAISFDTTFAIGNAGPEARNIADNYADMMQVNRIITIVE